MNKSDFHSLCDKLCKYETTLTIYQEPERGDKSKLKKVRQTLKDILGQNNLQNLTKEAHKVGRCWYYEQRTTFDSDEAEQAAKENRKDAETEYRKFCDDLYKATYPSAPPPEPVLPPEVIQRLCDLVEEIEEAKHKYQLAMDREKQAWADLAKIQTDTQAAREVVSALQQKAEMIRKGEL